MAFWHYPDGEPAPAFAPGAQFDWSHLMPLFVFAAAVLMALFLGKK